MEAGVVGGVVDNGDPEPGAFASEILVEPGEEVVIEASLGPGVDVGGRGQGGGVECGDLGGGDGRHVCVLSSSIRI